MYQFGILAILPVLLFGVQSLPSNSVKRHHVAGRSSAQLSTLDLKKHDLTKSQQVHHSHRREPRDIRMLRLKDPLDCLSQVVCGLNTYPPQKPSVRTTTANDFAFLLKNSVEKLRSQKPPTTTTTTTVAPATKRTTTKAPLDDEDDDEYDDDTSENDLEYESDDADDYYEGNRPPPIDRRRGRRYSIFSKRRGGESKNSKQSKKNKSKKGKSTKKSKKGNNHPKKAAPPNQPRPLTALDKLRMETNLRAKLLSDARCENGLIDHSCPFNYQQMLVLMSSSLERERTISYSSNKVLPMVGYLIKSRNYTGTLQATFTAIERINNYTIEADKEGKPIDFTHILDEVMNRVTPGDNGLRIVDTSNDSASASVWEDDEFDHVLQNPYERKRPQSDNYKLAKKREQQALKKKQKQKGSQETPDDDQSTTSEEDTSEEGLVFDRPRPPPGPPPGDGESSSEEDDVKQEDAKKKEAEKNKKKISGTGFDKQSLVPGPVFGFSHLQKSAEDE